jgi:hypothetical protein
VLSGAELRVHVRAQEARSRRIAVQLQKSRSR